MTMYYYRVSAMNSVGTGDPSDGTAYCHDQREQHGSRGRPQSHGYGNGR